jgi:TPR repeat protein
LFVLLFFLFWIRVICFDLFLTRRHFEIAAKQKEQWALYELGRLSFTGQGVVRNAANALKYFQQAAQGGHLPSLYNLALLSNSGYFSEFFWIELLSN